jgi:hypothetical protein
MSAPAFYYCRLADYTLTMSLTEDTSYPLANLKDYFADSLWKSSASTAGQTLVVDFGAARSCNYIVLDNTNIGSWTTVVLEAADDSGFTTNVATPISNIVGAGTAAYNTTAGAYEFSAVSRRYWRLRFATIGAIPQIGSLYLGTRLTFETEQEWGFRLDAPTFQTVEAIALDGRIRNSQSIKGRRVHELTFRYHSDTFRSAYETFLATVRGKLFPFYVKDHSTNLRLMHLDADYAPPERFRYNLNHFERLVLKEQLAEIY